PRGGLTEVARIHHREQRQRRIAKPAIAVVPVSYSADLLGQRRRGRGDDSAGRPVRERLERENGANDRVAPLTGVLAFARPRSPETLGEFERVLRVHGLRRR